MALISQLLAVLVLLLSFFFPFLGGDKNHLLGSALEQSACWVGCLPGSSSRCFRDRERFVVKVKWHIQINTHVPLHTAVRAATRCFNVTEGLRNA